MNTFYGGAEDAAEGIPLTCTGVEPGQQAPRKRSYAVGLVGLALATAAAAAVYGQTAGFSSSKDTANLMDIDDDDPYLEETTECSFNCGGDTLAWPEEVYSEDGALTYTLKVRKARYRGPLSFNTRSYSTNGFPGPTLRVKPGDRIDLTLENDLEYPTQADITWTGYEYDLATAFGACEPYNSPNMTSLHFHGLLISINKKGDSPMRMCGPKESINYQFTIPESHPSGTYFYHPHGDGSHSLQAAGLMAGVIIVEDENDGGNEGEDDTYHEVDDDNIDDFYAKDDDTDDGGGMPSEKKMVTTRTGNYVAETEAAHMTATTKLLNVVDDIPMVLQWQTIQATFKNYDFLSRCSHSSMPIDQTVYEEVNGYDWMLVNGLYKPHHTMLSGVYQKWRFVNAASHRYLGFSVPDECEAYGYASDGVYYESPRKMTFIALSLGARMDVLIKCDSDADLLSEEPSWLSSNQYTHIFGTDPGFYEHHFMKVNMTDVVTDEDKKKKAASDNIDKRLKAGTFKMDHGYFGMDLREGTDQEWAEKSVGEYEPTDHIDSAAFYNPILSDGKNTVAEYYTMNHKTYTGRIQHRVRMNEMQIWNITHKPITAMGHKKNHNWHLHTHHFQVMYATDEHGNVYTESPMKDWVTGDWRDTVSVPANGTVYIRWKPVLQKGLVLHHCHIYNHETAGMKEMMAVIDCSNTTLVAMRESVCDGITDDEGGSMEEEELTYENSKTRRAMRHLASVGANIPTEVTVWPWNQQNDKYQCQKTIDYLCSNSAMEMTYSAEYNNIFDI